jgi:hypothetical protein
LFNFYAFLLPFALEGLFCCCEGELERLKEFWLAGACHMNRKKSRNNRGITSGVSSSTLGILNFTSAFILLGAGTGNIGFFILFSEQHSLRPTA